MNKNKLNYRIGVVISEEDRLLLEKVCEARGEVMSSFIRRAIRRELASLGFYSEDVRKALGFRISSESETQ